MCRRNFGNDFEMRRHSTFYISKEHLPSHNKMCIRVSFKYIVKYVWNPTHLMGLMSCLTQNLMLPLVALTHATTRISEFIDSSILNLLNTNTPIFDYEIPLKSLNHQQQLILFTAISDLLVPLMCRRNSGSDFEKRRHSTFLSQKSTFQVITKRVLGFLLNT